MKVKFFPKQDVEVEICDIYEDRDAVIVQHTDTLQLNTSGYVEALGFKFGIKPTAFVWPYSSITTGFSPMYESGVLKFGVYVPTDRYRNINNIGLYLPDYASNQISQAGADYYGVELGSVKPTGYPNNGRELFDFTNGVKGYDVINSVAGSEGNMDFIREMEYIKQWYFNELGRYPSSGADRQGKIGSKQVYLPYYLGLRDTVRDGNIDYYNPNRVESMERLLTSRWENGFMNDQIPLYNQQLIDGINNAFLNKGLFNDFVHWHRAVTYGNIHWLHDLYELIYNTVDGRNAWYTGFSEAMEYMWYRDMTKRARGTIVGNDVYVVLDFDDELFESKIAGIDAQLLYDVIKQPLSVKLDLTGTLLEGKSIKSSAGGIISKGNNQYIIDVPFGAEMNGFKGVVLSEAVEVDYKDFSLPEVVSSTIVDNVLTINTNVATRAVHLSGDFNEQILVIERSNILSTSHSFTLTESVDSIGFCTKDGSTILHEVI